MTKTEGDGGDQETIWHFFDRRLRLPIREANHDYFVKTDPVTGEDITYARSKTTEDDVQMKILENMASRKKNILKREGD